MANAMTHATLRRRFTGEMRCQLVTAAVAISFVVLLSACGHGESKSTPTLEPTTGFTPDISATAGASTPTSVPASETAEAVGPTTTVTSPPQLASQPTTSSSSGGNPAFSPGRDLLPSDLVARGTGEPGRGPFNAERIIITRAEVDAPIAVAVVGNDGHMPSPPSISEAMWYDFSIWPGLGGSPGSGGNVVIAGDAYRPGQPAGVFAQLYKLVQGDYVDLRMAGGDTLCYRVEFNKIAKEQDYSYVTQATAEESITLITGGATPNTRAIVWGWRANCADEPPPVPTPTPTTRGGHHKLRIVAENRQFTIVEGGTVPTGIHTVDYVVDNRDSGVQHSITFYDTTGKVLITSDPAEGPIMMGGAFGVGPPQAPGQYTFRCSIHPQMTGVVNVQS